MIGKIEIDKYSYQDAVGILEELRSYQTRYGTDDTRIKEDLDKVLKLLTGENYEQE